jgi:hypothetical protein
MQIAIAVLLVSFSTSSCGNLKEEASMMALREKVTIQYFLMGHSNCYYTTCYAVCTYISKFSGMKYLGKGSHVSTVSLMQIVYEL